MWQEGAVGNLRFYGQPFLIPIKGEKMKKNNFAIAAAVFILLMFGGGVCCAADITINCNNFPFNVTDKENAGFSVSLNEDSYFGKKYTVEYSALDFSAAETIQTAYGKNNFKFNFTGLNNGVYNAEIKVKSTDGSLLSEKNAIIGIVDSYKSRPLEKFSRFSMGTHLMFNNQTDRQEIEFLNKIGVFRNREEIYWETVEHNGVWNFEKPDMFMNILKENEMDTVIILDYSNQKYVITDKFGNAAGSKTAPRTAEEMEAFTRYVKQVLERYPQIKSVEMWNEPNWGFWQPEPDAIDYSAMVKAVSSAAREVRDDIYVMCGSLVYSGHKEFLNEMIEEGVLDYVDGISTHPYSFPYGSDSVLANKLKDIDGIISKNGGFKEHIVTEIGLPTSTGVRGATEERQASEIVKSFAYDDDGGVASTNWYNFRNKGENAEEEEDNYGIINRDRSPKKALIALANLTNKLNGSVYFGSVELEPDLNAYLYLQNGGIIAIVWSKNGTKTVSLGCSYAEDIYGNKTEKIVSTEPIYLFDVDASVLNDALSEELYSIYSGAENQEITAKWLELSKENLTCEKVREIINEHITEGNKISESGYKENSAMSELEIYRKSLEKWAAMYGALGGEVFSSELPDISVSHTKVPDTSSVLKYAKRNKLILTEAENAAEFAGKQNALAYYSALVNVYSAWAEKLHSVEKKKQYTDVFLYDDPYMINAKAGTEVSLNITAVNKEAEDVSFYICLRDESGKLVASSDKLKLEPSCSEEVLLSWFVPGYREATETKYTISAESGSEVISKRGIKVKITSDIKNYDCFDSLKFEDFSKLAVTDIYSSVELVQNGEGDKSVHSGTGALYINGNGAIKVSAAAETTSIVPSDGDLIDGEYYLKVMESVPTDWKQPIIRLYGIIGTEKLLLCETENLNSFSVWGTKRYEWNRLTLKNTGIPYCSDMQLVCEITVGIGKNGGLKFMLDDISYFSQNNEQNDGYKSTYGVPKIGNLMGFDGGFESAANGVIPKKWGAYTPEGSTDFGINAFEISTENVYQGDASIKINRGGSMWNILNAAGACSEKKVGGYYMLYVSENAELKYNYPRVWVEFVQNGTKYTAAESPKHVSEYPLKPGWNKIPVASTGLKIPKDATSINLMIEAPNILDGDIINKPYGGAYYIDDINIGEVASDIYFSDNSYIENGAVNAILTNSEGYERTEGNVVAAAYYQNKLVSCDVKHVSMRGMSARGQQSVLFNMDIAAENADKIKLFFVNDDMVTPICEYNQIGTN